jgi:hypothetical protein
MTRRKNNAPLLQCADTGSRPAVADTPALAHFDKQGRAVGCTHDQVNFSATALGRSIIALHKAQTDLLQVVQRGPFGRIAHLFGRAGFSLYLRRNH